MDKDNAELQEAELVFQRHTYYVCMREAKGVTLSIEAERKTDGCRWRGDFTSRYIEEITQRVGNLKSFKTFVEMLKCAIFRKSTALHVDLLTYHDLEKLTVRRGAGNSHSAHSYCASTSDKRYLILTYVTEFDRVHYPLPLVHEDNAEPEALKRCIQRLRSELDYMKAQVRKSDTNPRSPDITAGASDQNSNISHGQAQVHGDPPVRSRPRLYPESPSRPRLAKSPSFESRSATRKLASPSISQQGSRSSASLPGSRSSSCPGYRSKNGSVDYSTREKPPTHPKLFSTRTTTLSTKDARDFGKERSPRTFSTKASRPLSFSSQDSSEDFRSKLLSHSRADREKAEKLNRKTSPRPKTMHAMSVEVEEIDSRLYALCNYLKSSHGK